MPLLAEAPNEQPAELRLVFYDQDAHAQIVAPGDERCMKRVLMGLSSPPGQLVPMTELTTLGRSTAASRTRSALGGALGNHRLTSLVGLVLLLGLAVEGATIPFLGSLLSVHIFVGMLLLGPVALKLASTGYRMARYYTRGPEYVRLGPPAPLMRVLVAPVLVLSTLTLFGTGVLLLAVPHRGTVLDAPQGELHRLVRGHGDPRSRLRAPRRAGASPPTSWMRCPAAAGCGSASPSWRSRPESWSRSRPTPSPIPGSTITTGWAGTAAEP